MRAAWSRRLVRDFPINSYYERTNDDEDDKTRRGGGGGLAALELREALLYTRDSALRRPPRSALAVCTCTSDITTRSRRFVSFVRGVAAAFSISG